MRFFLGLVLAFLSGCNNNDGNDSTGGDSVKSDKTGSETANASESLKNTDSNDSTIHIRFPKDSTSTTVEGEMKGVNSPVTVYIPVKQGRLLTAIIRVEDSTANVRINQMFEPDGKADGPFGRELKRKITQQGTYKFIIGENLMQGDEWKGKFKLTVRVE